MPNYTFEQLYPVLQSVQKPGRYIGGEYGSSTKTKDDKDLTIALCFPDLYEIGMSNQAVKILYNLLNSIEGVHCERVFAPMQDFESALDHNDLRLFSLENFTPIKEFDILAFSIGYELSFTNILAILKSSGIALKNKDREDCDPVVIAGGPAITNPIPFSSFIDFFFMGEAEQTIYQWVEQLKDAKSHSSKRQSFMDVLEKNAHFWYSQINSKVQLVRWNRFGQEESFSSGMPVPSVEVVQDHGVVEIMRGCPNKCRFCHAGVFYRPKREKKWSIIVKEIDFLVHQCGYRSITLSSLSTGDYTGIDNLLNFLNQRYQYLGVSFNLPSLRVNSISLKLLNLVSVVRKSGLTFAVEAPTENAQHGLNKDVSTERIINILNEARMQGWKQAKFYFMLGLPVSPENEEEKIIEYLNNIQHQTRMQLNVNIGTFIPKSFTPFAESLQLTEEISLEKIRYIKRNINNKRIRISYHSPFASFLEGIFSRGDEQAGELALKAFQKGARLDAWEEHLNRPMWQELIAEEGHWEEDICRNNHIQQRLNETLSLGMAANNLNRERERAMESELSPVCQDDCSEPCGVCNNNLNIENALNDLKDLNENPIESEKNTDQYENILLSYKKTEKAIYLGHLDVMHIFERAFLRAGLQVVMSQGYNPKPKIEFANPLSLGLSTEEDVFAVRIYGQKEDIERKLDTFYNVLPQGISLINRKYLNNKGKLRLMQNFAKAVWQISGLSVSEKEQLKTFISLEEHKDFYEYLEKDDSVLLNIAMEKCPYNNPIKLFRHLLQEDQPLSKGIYANRLAMLSKDKTGNFISFFELYQ